jgi:hypothetical protein
MTDDDRRTSATREPAPHKTPSAPARQQRQAKLPRRNSKFRPLSLGVPLTPEEKGTLAALMTAWATAHELRVLFAAASAIVRERFIAILRTVADAQDRFPTAL